MKAKMVKVTYNGKMLFMASKKDVEMAKSMARQSGLNILGAFEILGYK